MTFGEKLRAIRLAKNMSQDEFARLLNTTKQAISRYENSEREPNLRTAKEYANILGVNLNILADDALYLPVGEKVLDFRTRWGWDLDYLSQRTGLTKERLAAIERSDSAPELWELKALADGLCCSIDWLSGFMFEFDSGKKHLPSTPLTPEDEALLYAYHHASPEDRAIIDNIISRYPNNNAPSLKIAARSGDDLSKADFSRIVLPDAEDDVPV